ncbi:CDP-diacylglycerol-glycerol-3-phosphate 3-phosphatidyltransferase [Melia azedarach]|uniref:CDP-diacylglycerol-glycerol-3-phosphate 3-phosphatidyltransferase n=1 Tax=Melia azedarach TaxID=155640 RepID=A0ACC1XLR7_MELAZ|nr:CDP-diacylglycerol-glycerol-3-phosphate 3-phosphatidyltransferase [Melia azedarach]
MDGHSSYGTSWADQWDDGPDPVSVPQKKKSNGTGTGGKYKQKVGQGFDKTKAAASTGMKKIKEGTSVGFQWIKDKYHKTTQKH